MPTNHLTPEEAAAEQLAQNISDRVWEILKERFALEIGKSILKKLAWMVGFSILAIFFWLARKGIITLPSV